MKNFFGKNRIFLSITVFGAALAFAAAPALAQSKSAAQGAAQQGAQGQPSFDNQTLGDFASAQIELRKIQDEFAKKLQGVQDQKKAMEVQQKMNEQMVEAVQSEGLDVKTYNAIASRLYADEDLKERVEQMIMQRDN